MPPLDAPAAAPVAAAPAAPPRGVLRAVGDLPPAPCWGGGDRANPGGSAADPSAMLCRNAATRSFSLAMNARVSAGTGGTAPWDPPPAPPGAPAATVAAAAGPARRRPWDGDAGGDRVCGGVGGGGGTCPSLARDPGLGWVLGWCRGRLGGTGFTGATAGTPPKLLPVMASQAWPWAWALGGGGGGPPRGEGDTDRPRAVSSPSVPDRGLGYLWPHTHTCFYTYSRITHTNEPNTRKQ